MVDDFLIGGASAAGMILVLIQIAKMLGMGSKYAPILAALLGMTFSVLAELALTNADLAWWIRVIIRGFQLAMSVVGIYATAKFTQDEVDKRDLQKESEKTQTQITQTSTATPDTVVEEKTSDPLPASQVGTNNGPI